VTNIIPRISATGLGVGNYLPLPDAQPFSVRSGATYDDLLEAIRHYLIDELNPYLENGTQQAIWDANAATLTDLVNQALETQSGDVTDALNAAVQQVINADIPIATPIILGALQQSNSPLIAYLATQFITPTKNRVNFMTGMFHVDDYGAAGDGVTDDRAAIQQAVIDANALYVTAGARQKVYLSNKIYSVGVAGYYLANNGGQNGIVSVTLLDGVELCGHGTIKTKQNAYGDGALYGVIRSQSQGLSHATIRDITIDGNKDNNPRANPPQASNILLECFTDVVIDNVKSLNANGIAIMVRGKTNQAMTNVQVINCDVEQANNIGIQASQFDGLKIVDNIVNGTGDNCIDIYGDNGTVNANGVNFTISGNHCFNGTVGIFLETVSTGKTVDNLVDGCQVAIHVNRINGEPNKLLILGNELINCIVGLNGTGDTGGVTFRGNLVEGFTQGGCVFGGAGNVSGYYILDNTMNAYQDGNIPLVLFKDGTHQIAKMVHMRTMTRSKNRAYDTVNQGPTAVDSTWTPALSPGDTVAVGQ
jgi:hypothetical protein